MADVVAARLIIPIETNAAKAAQDTQKLTDSMNRLSTQSGQFANTQKQVVSGVDASRNSMQKMGDTVNTVRNAIGAFMALQVVSFLKNTATECINAAIAADEVKESFVAMTGSMEAATAIMAQIQGIKDLGVFTRGDINTATQQLLRMGVSAEEVGRTMNMLSNYAAGAYIPINELVNAYSRSAQTGVVTQRQLMAFGSFLGTEFRNKVRAGTATFEDLQRAMLAATEGSGIFANALATRAQEVEATFMRLENNSRSTKVAIGQGLLPEVGRLALAFESLTSSTNKEAWKSLGEAIGWIIQPITDAIQGLAQIMGYVSRLVRFINNLEAATGAAGISAASYSDIATAWANSAVGTTRGGANRFRGGLSSLGSGEGGGGAGGTPIVAPNPYGSTPISDISAMAARGLDQREADEAISANVLLEKQKANNEAQIELDKVQSEQRIKVATMMWGAITNTALKAMDIMANAEQQRFKRNIERIKALYDYQKDYINSNVTDEKEKQKQLQQLDLVKGALERREKRKAFEASQKYAIAQIQISTAMGITAAWATAMSLGPVAGIIVGALETAMLTGLMAMQMSAVMNAQAPTAQFGGSFEVPPGFGADSALLRVNSGERVDVTPARQSDNGGSMMLKIGEREFEAYMTDTVNRIVNSGNVVITRKGAVRVA